MYEHSGNAASDVYLPLHSNILECLLPELGLSEGTLASGNRTRRGSMREYSVDTRLAHFVIALWVDEKPHVWVQVPRALADRADT